MSQVETPDLQKTLQPELLSPGDILIPAEQVQERIRSMAVEIADQYKGRQVLLVGLLNGVCIFMADLVRELYRAGLTDAQIDFMKVEAGYNGENASSGSVSIRMDTAIDPVNRDVLLIDDIGDSLYTLQAVSHRMQERGARSFATSVLLEKPSRHEISFPIDFVGFRIPNVWVEGYGMDSDQFGRGNPNIVKGPFAPQRAQR